MKINTRQRLLNLLQEKEAVLLLSTMAQFDLSFESSYPKSIMIVVFIQYFRKMLTLLPMLFKELNINKYYSNYY